MTSTLSINQGGVVEVDTKSRLGSSGAVKTESDRGAQTKLSNQQLGTVRDTVMRVFDVFATYFWDASNESGNLTAPDWPGRERFEGHAAYWISREQPVQMVLPAFPFKSVNPDKVMGRLPDLAELLGLSRLNQMCLDVREVYSPGAQIILATDGVVFNDLVLVSDSDVWAYGQAIHEMINACGFQQNIKFVHAMELLGITAAQDLTEDVFYQTMGQCRDRIIAQFVHAEEKMQRLIETDPDSCLTYAGIKTFCKVDQANSVYRTRAASRKAFLRDMSSLALKILARSEGFGKLIRQQLPNHIRLSIHPSSGLEKLSICLLPQPQGFVARAPWMSTIVEDQEGNHLSLHSGDVRHDHELVCRDGQPWMYREHC